MRQYFKTSQLSEEEKSDILSKHRTTYNGYRALHPEITNTPLYVQDFAGDKDGMVINNKGEVKKYTNFRINESKGETCEQCGGETKEGECMECGNMYENEGETCEQCGNRINEGETCEQCGKSNESYDEMKEISVDKLVKGKKYKYKSPSFEDEIEYDETQEYPDGEPMHAFKGKNSSWHSLGSLDFVHDIDDIDEDIYDVEDLNPNAGFDYLEGESNKKNVFKKRKMDLDEMDEYEFNPEGPGLGGAYPVNEYEHMESAWDDEVNEDVSGVQGIYGDMEPAYDFDSDGPGSAGPYQTSSWGESEMEGQFPRKHEYNKMMRKKDALSKGEDFDDSEFDISDYGDDIRDKSWEEITAMTGDDEFSNVDEDIRESFLQQKNKITEMFIRMKKF